MIKSNYGYFLATNKLFFGLVCLFALSVFPYLSFSQTVAIPRDGFPYCEPFRNSTTRANTVFDGIPNTAFLTAGSGDPDGDGFLRLTDNTIDQRGYVFVDLPFSSAYGLKVSFEYFAYGGINPPAYADGISFFMFDGAIGPDDGVGPSGPTEFQIGGLGGSLGYSPWRSNNGAIFQPGLKGAYLGIGFDAFRNWGNEYEGRFGGFKDPNATGFGGVPDERQYYNSIAIRGPESSNYQFIDGKRTFSRSFQEEQPSVYLDPIASSYYLFENLQPLDYLARRFKIGSVNRAEICSEDGYRKVFIDLFPVGGGNYLLTVDMLVNNGGTLRLENIFNNLPYNFPAPKNLKIGFAASTGTPNTNFHEIRNVTAQVSDYTSIPIPEIQNLGAEVCKDEENLFEFDVTLLSENSFVRCVQLFENNPGPPDNSAPTEGDPSLTNCGLSNVCVEKCNPINNSITVPGKGTFTVILEELTSDNFDIERFKASVKFEPIPGFVGTAEVFYQVLDNYGLLSEAKTITVVSNPDPIVLDTGSLDYPSCDGQDDGRIFGVEFGDLVSGYDYNWTYTNTSGTSINLGKVGASVVNSGNTATFELQGLNLGTYTLTVSNPSDGGGCPESIDILVDQEQGTPITLSTPDELICEGQGVTFVPGLNNPSGAALQFLWYTEADRSGGALSDGSMTIDGVNVQVSIATNGELTLTGLMSAGSSPRTYDFFVEVQDQNVPSGNFCPFIGDVLSRATVQVLPPLVISATDQEDWCLNSSGSISVSTTGSPSGITFTLLNSLGNTIATNASGNFTGLSVGDYEVFATSTSSPSNPSCTSVILPIKIEGPLAPLGLALNTSENTFCGISNGLLSFDLQGGNLPYSTITINGNSLPSSTTISGNTYSVPNLGQGSHIIRVVDDKGCAIQISQNIGSDPLSQFAATSDEICEGEIATVSPTIVSISTSTPTYKWFYRDGASTYIEISNGLNVSGVTFTINGSNELSVANLAPQATPYTYYLQVTGSKVCDQGYIPAEILVNPKPVLTTPLITQVTCNGASNGTIQAQLASGNLGDFQYSLTGNNGVNRPFTNNSGLFTLLPPGTYELTARSNKGCESSIGNLIMTEPSVLLVNEVSKVDATCDINNGIIRFTVAGGSPDGSGKYVIRLNGANINTLGTGLTENGPTDFTVSNLAPGIYTIEAEDVNGCTGDLSITIQDTPVPVFDADDITVCEGTDVVLTPKVISNTIGAVPVYAWSYENPSSPGQFIQLSSGDVVNDATHNLSNGILTIKGLKYAVTTYKYYLTVTGSGVCPVAPIETEVTVLKIPTAVFETVAVSCFGGTNGQINLTSVDTAGPNTFTLIETGASNSTGNFSNLNAGTYTIRIRETGSPCDSEVEVVVTEPAKLEVLNPLKSDPTCGESNGSFSFDVLGGVKNYEILINGDPISDYSFGLTGDRYEVKNLALGSYSIEVADANGCEEDKPNLFILSNDDGLTVNINPLNEEKCVGSPAILNPTFGSSLPVTPTFKWYKDAGLLQPIVSSATPDADNISYTINSSGVLTIFGLPIGDFKYFLEVSGPGICTLVEEANVKIFPEIIADFVTEDIVCFGGAEGSISITLSGGNGTFETRLNGGAYSTSTSYTNLAAGNYTIDIRNDLDCIASYPVEIKGPSGPISINTPTIIRTSCGLDNGSIENLVISGGWNSYDVEWRFGSITGPLVPGNLTGAQNLAEGTYYLLVSDAEGCEDDFQFVIEKSSDPVYAIVPPINACTGPPVIIRPIHLAPNPSLPPASATEVRWYTEPGQTGLIQNGPDISNPAIQYTIDDSDWLNPELVIAGLPAGTYDFYFYVVCTGQEIKIDIIVYDTPTVAVETKAIVCFGDSNGKVSILSGGLPSYTYSVNGGSTISQTAFEALSFAAGTYSLEVETPAGCAQNLSFTIDGPSAALAVTPLTKVDPGCNAPNGKLELTVTGGWLPYTLDIKKDGVSQGLQIINENVISLDGYSPGVYQITITDKEGCIVNTNSVTLVDGPTQVLVGRDDICIGSEASLLPVLTPIAPGATFQWFLDAAKTQPIVSSPSPAADGRIYQINTTTGELIIGNLPASVTEYNYYVTASGSGVCSGFTGNGKVRVYSNPTATATVVNEVCFATGGSITINTSGGSGVYSYSLNGGAFGSTNVFQVPAGSYTVQVRTPEGCLVTLPNIEVIGPGAALSTSNLSQDDASCGLDNGEVRFDISGGYAPYSITYTKNGSNAGVSNLAAAGQVRISNLGIGTYEFTVIDAQGCSITVPSTFTLTEVPTVLTANDDEICKGEVAESTPSAPQNIPNPQFIWSFDIQGTSLISNETVNGVTYGISASGVLTVVGLSPRSTPYLYYVNATGVGICGLEAKSISIKVNEIPALRVSNPSVVCDPNGTVDLTDYIEGFNPSVYDYNVLSPFGSAIRLDELDNVGISGDYRISSSFKGTGCFNQSQRIRVLIAETELIANFQYEADLGGGILLSNAEIQIQENVNFQDLSQGNVLIWDWNFGDGNSSSSQNPIHQYQEKGSYVVKLTTIDSIGCISSYEIVVEVLDDYIVMIPNAFTPTGAKNLTFRPYYRGIASMEFYIFNTWGELIYEAKSMEDQGWDGTLNGKNVPNGNYVYKGRFVSRSGEVINKSGVFVLIR